jgi:hypothetical protein
MSTINHDLYDEKSIRAAEKMTERYRTKKSMKEIKHFIKSRLFKELDFPPDENPDDEIYSF